MNCVLRSSYHVPLSRCDLTGRLSIPDTFAACQDIATEHAERIGVGGNAMMSQGLFWLTARTRIRFHHRPGMLRSYELETWPCKPGPMRCDRFYRASIGDRLLFEGRTEWCVWNIRENKAQDPRGLFADDLEFSDEVCLSDPYRRFRHDFTEADRVMDYTVLPSDIDLGNHMNNVAYPRLLSNSFTTAELASMPLREMELLFMMPCMEGDALSVYRRATDEGYEFGIRRPDGRWAAFAVMVMNA